MNAFYQHHQDNIAFHYRCFDRILFNGLIQPFQQPERVIGFFNTYRHGQRVTRHLLTDIADQFRDWIDIEKRPTENARAPIDLADNNGREARGAARFDSVKPGRTAKPCPSILTAGEFDSHPNDKSKDTGILFPAAQLIIDKQGQCLPGSRMLPETAQGLWEREVPAPGRD
jgi:hypothetical protein